MEFYLAVFCEGKACGLKVTWILYGPAMERAGEIRSHWNGLLDRVFPEMAAAGAS